MEISLLEMENRIKQLKIEKDACFDLFSTYATIMVDTNEKMSKLMRERDNLKVNIDANVKSIAHKDKLIEKLTGEVDTLESNLSLLKDKLREMEETYTEEKNRLSEEIKSEFESEISRLENELAEERARLENEVRELNEEIRTLREEKVQADEEFNDVVDKYNALEDEKEALEERVKSLIEDDKNDESALQTSLKELEATKEKVEELEKEVKEHKDKEEELETMVNEGIERGNKLNEQVTKLTKELKVAKSISSGDGYEVTLSKMKNTKIITVLGLGGSGITTIAVSIMKELSKANKKVCYLDLDFSNPDSESLIKKNPIIRDGMTSLELMKKNEWSVKDIINIPSGGYISGVMVESKEKWQRINFNELFKTLDNSGFDYIVVDCGEFGVSTDRMVFNSALCKISNTTFIVCEDNKYRCSKLFNMLKKYKISGKLVVNKSIKSKVDEIIKRFDQGFIQVPFEMDLYNSREPLSACESTKSRVRFIMSFIK